jgi:hypothetical protein
LVKIPGLALWTVLLILGASGGVQAEELESASFILRAGTLSGGGDVDLRSTAAVPTIGSLSATIGQPAPVAEMVGTTSGLVLRGGFWSIIAGPRAVGFDTDGDGILDPDDNCPFVANVDQTDTDQNDIGDACQCGDVNGDGITNVTDALAIARGEVLSSDPNFGKCDVNGDGVCNVTDALGIARGEISSLPGDQRCPAYEP